MNAFEDALAVVLQHEGFFSNDPRDRGGATTYGITEEVARGFGYIGDMKEFPVKLAKEIYRHNYWGKNRLDEIAAYDKAIATEMLDTAVNMGSSIAGEFLQAAINALNHEPPLFPNLKEDGIIGSKTIETLNKLHKLNEKICILKMLDAQQCKRYMKIRKNNPSQARFIVGWVLNRIGRIKNY